MRNRLAIFLTLVPLLLQAQQGCWVYFKDKGSVTPDALIYLDAKAIERRQKHGIPLNAYSDLPVNSVYTAQVTSLCDSVLFVSRWFNAMAVFAGDRQLEQIMLLTFVEKVEKATRDVQLIPALYDTVLDDFKEDILIRQITSMQGEKFLAAGLDGKGVRIAIFDVGFPGADVNPAFEKIRNEGRLIATKDFSKKKDNVYWGSNHGTHVWSCIGGMVGSRRTGLATGAEYLLAKTEVSSEPFREEVNWLAAAEWADRNGADIINSSLGYTQKRYFPWDMDGKTSFVTRAANMAARKGILVVNAAGNEGDAGWHKMGAPADADSALSVGGIDPYTGYHISFSSYGPTADKRMKPNVSAFGSVVVSGSEGFGTSQGTSFASPLVAGFAACALQASPKLTNMELFREIEKSGSLHPYFDYAHGFGIPLAGSFLSGNANIPEPTFRFVETADSVKVIVDEGTLRDQSKETRFLLFYNIMNSAGVLDAYYVLAVSQPDVLVLSRSAFGNGESLNVHYAGFAGSYPFKKEK